MTREQKLMDTDLWKSEEWFTAGRAAQSVSLTVGEIRTLLDGMVNNNIAEKKRIQGKAMVFRKRKPFQVLPMRKRRYEWEADHQPRYY